MFVRMYLVSTNTAPGSMECKLMWWWWFDDQRRLLGYQCRLHPVVHVPTKYVSKIEMLTGPGIFWGRS